MGEQDFGGNIGAGFLTFFLPTFTLVILSVCNGNGSSVQEIYEMYSKFGLHEFWESLKFILKWLLTLIVLEKIVPGKIVKGTILRDGKTRLEYKLNGLRSGLVLFSSIICKEFLMNYIISFFTKNGYKKNNSDLEFVYKNLPEVCFAAIFVSYSLALFIYFRSFIVSEELVKVSNVNNNKNNITENLSKSINEHTSISSKFNLSEWFLGRPLNPRIFGIDVKFFCELRPGLLLWGYINLACMIGEYKEVGYVTFRMILVCVMQWIYIIDALWNEQCVLTTMDITTDGFGLMLAFGDLVWVPFIYSLQAYFLATHANEVIDLNYTRALFIIGIQLIGFTIFRGANSEKDSFRNASKAEREKKYKYIEAYKVDDENKEESRVLLISGWWGMARHINYLGDWMMAWAWSLCAAFTGASNNKNILEPYVVFFYVLYFGILLVHRERRDDAKCSAKYGKYWDEYKRVVKYRIIPYVY